MPDEPPPSLLGGLVDELSRALADGAPSAEVSAASTVSHVEASDALPISAILELRDSRIEDSAAAVTRAREILIAAGRIGSTQGWSLTVSDQVLEVGGEPLVVGRLPRPDVAIVVPDMLVSRVHCRFVVVSGRLQVEDLGSTNGMVVRRSSALITVEPNGTIDLAIGDVVTVSNDVVIATVHSGSVA